MTNEAEAESGRHGPDYELVDFILASLPDLLSSW